MEVRDALSIPRFDPVFWPWRHRSLCRANAVCCRETATAGAKWTPPRTPDGRPDLQGVWSYATLTPLERPAEFAGKEFLTEQEAADYESRILRENNRDRRDGSAEADVTRAYNDFWWDRGTKVVSTRRTSLVVDPPDGKIPPLTPEAQKTSRGASRSAGGCIPRTVRKIARWRSAASCSAAVGRRCSPPPTTTTPSSSRLAITS